MLRIVVPIPDTTKALDSRSNLLIARKPLPIMDTASWSRPYISSTSFCASGSSDATFLRVRESAEYDCITLAASATVVRVASANCCGVKSAFFRAASMTSLSIVSMVLNTLRTASLTFWPSLGLKSGARIITYLATSIALRLMSVRICAWVNSVCGDRLSSTLRPSKISNSLSTSSCDFSNASLSLTVAGSSAIFFLPANLSANSCLDVLMFFLATPVPASIAPPNADRPPAIAIWNKSNSSSCTPVLRLTLWSITFWPTPITVSAAAPIPAALSLVARVFLIASRATAYLAPAPIPADRMLVGSLRALNVASANGRIPGWPPSS